MLLLLAVALIGLGFLNALWWVAAIVVIFGAFRYGRTGGVYDPEYRAYRDQRDRRARWDRRYAREREGRRRREVRRWDRDR
nr:hypothetical protein [Streptomyces sp. SID8379]